MKKAFLLLADGTIFEGQAVGHEGKSIAEIVFNTGMAGYPAVLTDSSYYGQSVCMTYPMIGNYGINFEDGTSRKSWVSGLIMREGCEHPSNWRCEHTLDAYLKAQKVVGLAGIDTRRLTRVLRDSGAMNGILYTEGCEPTEADKAALQTFVVKDAVRAVATRARTIVPAVGNAQYRVALYDFGETYGAEHELAQRGCEVTVVPFDTPADEVLSGKFDGVLLSNGPGDPAENTAIIAELQKLVASGMPLLGTCLGHQLLALACGAKTEKLKQGHRGVNHPVKDIDRDRTYITNQNHGFAVVTDSVDPAKARVRYININDKTVEGLEYIGSPSFSVQFQPAACPGPMDTAYLFDQFIENMQKTKRGAQSCH